MPISLTPTLSPGEREFSLVSRPISGAVGDGDGDGCGQLHHGVAVRLGQLTHAFEFDVGVVSSANSVVANFVHAGIHDAAKLLLQRFEFAGFELQLEHA